MHFEAGTEGTEVKLSCFKLDMYVLKHLYIIYTFRTSALSSILKEYM